MKIEKVKVNFGRTVGSGIKFEFIRMDVSMESAVLEGEDPNKIARMLKRECKTACDGMIGKELEVMHGK